MLPEFFRQFQLCIGWWEGKLQEHFEKDALFHDSLCTDNLFSPPPLRFLLRRGGGGGLYTGYFMREPRNWRKLWILPWILKFWILSRGLLSRIVAISITIIFLSPMFASLYFYSFPNPPPPLPHFHCFPSTTTITTTRNTTYLRHLLLCISLIIDMKKQRRKIKNVVSPALIIQHANTNWHYLLYRKELFSYFHLLAMLWIIM